MGQYLINESLAHRDCGINNYNDFVSVIQEVITYYNAHIDQETMSLLDLFIDNATENCGYAPVTMPIFNKLIIIKLGVHSDYQKPNIAYQFVHEMMHFVYFARYGFDRLIEREKEEAICTAASLIYIRTFYPQNYESCYEHVKGLRDNGYRSGITVAETVNYDFDKLVKLV